MCLLAITVSPTKTTEKIEVPFGCGFRLAQGTMKWVGSLDPPGERAILGSIVKCREYPTHDTLSSFGTSCLVTWYTTWIMDVSFPCTFVPGNETTIQSTVYTVVEVTDDSRPLRHRGCGELPSTWRFRTTTLASFITLSVHICVQHDARMQ